MAQKYELDGQLVTFSEAAELTGLSESTLRYRMSEYGMTLEEAVKFVPHQPERFEYQGKMMSYEEISKITGIMANTIRARVRAGVPLEIAATAKKCPRKPIGDEAVSQYAALRAWKRAGTWQEIGAKKICHEFGLNDPRDFGFVEVESGRFAASGEKIKYRIAYDGNMATATAILKKNGANMLHRRYYVTFEGNIREVHA